MARLQTYREVSGKHGPKASAVPAGWAEPVALKQVEVEQESSLKLPEAGLGSQSKKGSKARTNTVNLILLIALLLSIVFSTCLGAVRIPAAQVIHAFLHPSKAGEAGEIIFALRLPRVLAAALVGAALSATGVLFQGLFRNPLADPFVLGTSGGAALGGAIGIFLIPTISFAGFSATAVLAFAGSVLTMILVWYLARTSGAFAMETLLLAGFAIGTMLNSATVVFELREEASSSGLRVLAAWLHGQLGIPAWSQLALIAPLTIVAIALALPVAGRLEHAGAGRRVCLATGRACGSGASGYRNSGIAADRGRGIAGRPDRICGTAGATLSPHPDWSESRSTFACRRIGRRNFSHPGRHPGSYRFRAHRNSRGRVHGILGWSCFSLSLTPSLAGVWSMSSTILEFQNVSFSRGSRLLLDRLSFSIETQEMVALLGPNGVGKTTMLKLASRLLQPATGSVLLQSKPLADWSRQHLPRCVALVPQELELPFNFRVEEIVAQGRVPYLPLFGAGTTQDEEAIEDAMEAVDIVRLRDRPYSQLSGGERQRVKIAIGLAQQSKLMLLDEPTQHLDVGRQIELIALLRRLNQRGITIIAAVHDLNLVAENFSSVIMLTPEPAWIAGSVPEVMQPEVLARAFCVGQSDLAQYCVSPPAGGRAQA